MPCDGENYLDWTYTYTVDIPDFVLPPNGGSIVSCPNQGLVAPGPPPMNDACGRPILPTLVSSPTAVACEGQMDWVWNYRDCAGNSHNWTYTYTVDYTGGLTAPSNGSSTVSCPADAVNPGAPAVITDVCGRPVAPVLIGSVSTPDPITCDGTVIWTYRYTACDGTTTADWTYTYTIDYTGALTAPSPGTSIVSCPDDAVDPGPPRRYY